MSGVSVTEIDYMQTSVIANFGTLVPVYCRWQMQAKIPMASVFVITCTLSLISGTTESRLPIRKFCSNVIAKSGVLDTS